MKTKTYKGWLGHDEYDFLTITKVGEKSDLPLAELITEDWKKGDQVSLRYYIADKPMTENQATGALIQKLYGGDLDAEYDLEAYSEYTIEAWEEGLKIGGHDLIKELEGYSGKYIIVVVEAR